MGEKDFQQLLLVKKYMKKISIQKLYLAKQ